MQCFGPLALFHVDGNEATEERATSILNVAEASMVLSVYMELRARYSHLGSSNQIAVISPYKAQVWPRASLFTISPLLWSSLLGCQYRMTMPLKVGGLFNTLERSELFILRVGGPAAKQV